MSRWIEVSNSNICPLLLRSILVMISSHSYSLLVPLMSCVIVSYVCGFYHANIHHYVHCEAQELGKVVSGSY